MPTENEIAAYLRGLQSRSLLRRGYNVQARARRLLSGDAGHPRRVNTGDLRSSVQVTLVHVGADPAVRVGSNRRKATWVHRGTGIYGPHHQVIRPRRAQALRFRSAAYGAKTGKNRGYVFARTVRGMRANHFLSDALSAAKD